MRHLAILRVLLALTACTPKKSNPLGVYTSKLECLGNASGEVIVTMQPTADAKGDIRFNVRVTLDNGHVVDLPEKSGGLGSSFTETVFLAVPKHIAVFSSSHNVYYDLKRFDPAICGRK